MKATLDSYLETALWSSVDDNGFPMDATYTFDDIAPETVEQAKADIERFEKLAEEAGIDLSEYGHVVGHDFWLTRNHHGAGFWDGDYPKEVGIVLTSISHLFPEIDLYIDDNNRLWAR